MDDPVGRVDREHRLQRLALEGQLAVGIVLEDPEAVLGGQLDQPRPLRGRERAAGGVVEVGDDVGELDRPVLQRGFELRRCRARRPPAAPAPARPRAAAASAACGRRSAARRRPDRRPRADARTASSRASSDPLAIITWPGIEPPVPLGDPLAEPGMADPGPVGERLFPVLGQRDGGSLPHRLAGQNVGAGGAARKRNRVVGHRPRA